ncbi:MAG: methylenetetrahydrofolate reductase, partial [Saprospiraceae bacterium]
GFSVDETENALIDLNFLGINNVLALRGDARQFEDKFIAEPEGHKYALDLVKQIKGMNQGNYLDTDLQNGVPSDFCIGIAGYPEKHFESPNIQSDMHFTKEKVKAGADYIVTQMFFDNKKYFEFVDTCRANGIDVPIVPGLKPLTRRYQLNSIPRKFFVNMPEDLVKATVKANDEDAVKEIGIEWCIAQSKELKAAGVPCLHYYTMGDTETVKRIAEAIS